MDYQKGACSVKTLEEKKLLDEKLFNLVGSKVSNPNGYRRLILAKYQEYTIQYESGLGVLGMNSQLTIWRYDNKIYKVTCKQLTVNDKKNMTTHFANLIPFQNLIDAIEQDQMVSIGNMQQLWRITLGGYIASKRSKLASVGN